MIDYQWVATLQGVSDRAAITLIYHAEERLSDYNQKFLGTIVKAYVQKLAIAEDFRVLKVVRHETEQKTLHLR